MVQTQHFDSQIVFLNIKLYPFLYPSSTPPPPARAIGYVKDVMISAELAGQ